MRSLVHNSLAQLTLVRIREFSREPEAVFWTFAFPVLLALGLGIAFRDSGPVPVRVAVVSGAGAAGLVEALEAAGLEPVTLGADSAAARLRRGDVGIVAEAVEGGVVYRYDPTRPDALTARYRVDEAVQRRAGRQDVVATRDEQVTGRGSRYIDWLIPGLIGLNLLSTGLWGVGFTLVRMRTEHLMKRLMATPMKRAEFLASFFFGRLLFLGGELAVLLLFAALVFDVAVRGSLAALILVAVLGAFTFTAFGLLIASRARTTEGVSGLMNAASFPMWVLSGVFFSYRTFPEAVHPFIQALPLTALNDAMRAIMNDGLPLAATLGSLAVLAAWAAGSFALALAIFRWR
ncbi:MAG TPA: ABC transporter permease [Longimicrobiales bacterium]|nr:ABC transporter permease [Longimicrobiales bacterium]